jgi:hypothetical protein
MALTQTQKASSLAGNLAAGTIKTDPSKYTAINDLLTSADAYNRPDVREMLVKTFGDQGITGFLTLTGATKNAGQADQVEYFEERRRHKRLVVDAVGTASGITAAGVSFDDSLQPLVNDVLINIATGARYICATSNGVGGTGTSCSLVALTGNITAVVADQELAIIGNMYAQGTDQPAGFTEPGVDRLINPFMIIKERFQVNGSQATNIGYINTGNGDYRWFMYGEQEARKRFMDKREMMMLFSNKLGDTNDGVLGRAGSEGYFSAVEERGNISTGTFETMTDIDNIIIELDKQGAPSEYAIYVNRAFDLAIDDLLAQGVATQVTAGLPGQFGAFNNSADMAVQLGFKSFTRGGYTFHKHSWKLLNDPTLLAGSKYAGAMIPMTQVADARTGVKSPALEMNYKAANGYSRELEHWVTGGGVLGYTNNGDAGKDVATFHYRSECNLITRAANQHVVLKSA